MAVTLEQQPQISEGDVDVVSIDYTSYLDSDETLSGTPTVTEVTTADLTLASKAVSSAALVILGRTVAIAKAVQFSVSGQQSGTTYRVRVSVATSASRTKVVDVLLVCV